MKIAILSCFYPYRGGIAQFNAYLANELGREHTVRAFNFSRQYPGFLFPGKTQYVTEDDDAVQVPSERLLDSVNPINWVLSAKKIRKWDPDILIVRYWTSYLAPSLGFVCKHMKKGCRVLAITDNVIPHEKHFFDSLFTRYFLGGVDGCVTLCERVGKDLDELDRKMPHTTLEHPVYTHFGARMPKEEAEDILGLPHGGRNILFFGLIREYKGLDILIQAFSLLGDEYRLIIAGEPYGSFAKYQELIDRTPAKERIHCFTEYIKDSDVKKFFSAADVCVLPYRSATQSGISTVSNHFEVPMIVTSVGGLPETIGRKGTGVVCPDSQPETVANAIDSFFTDANLREDCIANIRKENQRRSWTTFCTDFIEYAKSLDK